MIGFFKRVSGFAASEEIEKTCSEAEILINRLSFFSFITTYFYTFCFFIFGMHIIGRSQIPFILFYSFVPWLTYKEKYALARILIYVSVFSQLSLVVYLLAKS